MARHVRAGPAGLNLSGRLFTVEGQSRQMSGAAPGGKSVRPWESAFKRIMNSEYTGFFDVNLLHSALLYAVRVKLPRRHIAGAALAAMSLQMTVARAVGKRLLKDHMPFRRTEKGGLARLLGLPAANSLIAGPETCVGVALAAGAAALVATNNLQMLEINVFAATLAVQSLPFLAAPAMVVLERIYPLLGRLTARRAGGPSFPLAVSRLTGLSGG